MSRPVPALEIGGTHVSAGLVDLPARNILPASRRRLPLDAGAGADTIIQALLTCAATLRAQPDQPWGVAVPGPFDYQRGVALFHGVGKFDALYGVDLGTVLRDRIPGRPSAVSFLNDANAFLLGEWIAGAASGHDRAVGITLGTGIGSAFLDGGTLVEDDPRVPPEGRVDLLTHGGRPLEESVSRQAIRAHYRRRPGADPAEVTAEVRDIAQRARTGDPAARRVIAAAFTVLGHVLAPWLRSFAPTVLVVGGAMSRSWDLIGDPLRAGIGHAEPGVLAALDVVTAHRPDDASLLGAAWHAHRRPRSDRPRDGTGGSTVEPPAAG